MISRDAGVSKTTSSPGDGKRAQEKLAQDLEDENAAASGGDDKAADNNLTTAAASSGTAPNGGSGRNNAPASQDPSS